MRMTFLIPALFGLALAQAPGEFATTGNLNSPRYGHSATLLPDGRVLFAGGLCPATDSCRSSLEIFDPASGESKPAGTLRIPRHDHAAILLGDGRVLFVGGNLSSELAGKMEIYDPATRLTTIPDLQVASRASGAAILLADGKILLACGGIPAPQLLDLQSRSVGWLFAKYPPAPFCESAAAVPDNKLFFANQGRGMSLLDLSTGALQFQASDYSTTYQDDWDYVVGQSSTTLPNGKVVVAGGIGPIFYSQSFVPLGRYEIYDPVANQVESRALLASRYYHASCLSPDGLLLSGGNASGQPLYDTIPGLPASFSAQIIGLNNPQADRLLMMKRARLRHSCTVLNDGSVLLAGGEYSGEMERYVPVKQWPALRIAAAVAVAGGQALELYASGILEDSKLPPAVWINGEAAPVLYFGPSQINVLIPEQLRGHTPFKIQFQYLGRHSNQLSLETGQRN